MMMRLLSPLMLSALLALMFPVGRLSAQTSDPPRGDLRLVVISDMNSSYGSTDYGAAVDSTIARIHERWRPDLVLAGGDMVAGQDKSLTDERVRAMWEAFDEHVAAPLRRAQIPFGFTIGNHDGSAVAGYERDRALASEYWNDPAHDPQLAFVDRAQFPFHYTFMLDDVFVLVWDASSATVRHLDWVEAALAGEAARSARMRIVVGHLPIYGVAIGRNLSGEVLDDPEGLRALLERYDIHTYVSGHHHAYYPGRRGDTQFLHAGAIGSGERPLIGGTGEKYKTVTVVDVDLEQATTTYTTYEPLTWRPIETSSLPRAIRSVNGLVLRRDVEAAGSYGGVLSPCHVPGEVASPAVGTVEARVEDGRLVLSGSFHGLVGSLRETDGSAVHLFAGANGSEGSRLQSLDATTDTDTSGTFEGVYELSMDSRDRLLAGDFFVQVSTEAYPEGELRAQLLPAGKHPPGAAGIH